jgi:hypothetical protein
MKIRTGFVSNSSSSSFVVLFPKEPKNSIDVRNMLFKANENFFQNPYVYDDSDESDFGWSTEVVAETVWKDICNQEKNDFEKAKEMITSGTLYGEGAPDYDDYDHIKDWDKKMEVYHSDMNRFAEKKMKEFFNLRKLKLQKINKEQIDDIVLYCFEYSDNDGTYNAALEHGDLFRNLKHITISNH